jgi:hypothetical protein
MTDAADDATAAMANVSLEGVSTVEVIKPANTGMPPGRVRFAFKKLDADNSGGVDLDELKTGLAKEFGVDELAPHVIAAMEEKYNLHAEEKDGKKVLTAKVFGRYFCEVMFRHFDKDNSGTLELAEVQEALKFLVKPDADGNKVAPIIAFPPELTTESGEVHLPISWFWPCVHADSNPRPPPRARALCALMPPLVSCGSARAVCVSVPVRPPTLQGLRVDALRTYALGSLLGTLYTFVVNAGGERRDRMCILCRMCVSIYRAADSSCKAAQLQLSSCARARTHGETTHVDVKPKTLSKTLKS